MSHIPTRNIFIDNQESLILNILLATTVVNELVGPLSTRFALQRAGELGTPRERV